MLRFSILSLVLFAGSAAAHPLPAESDLFERIAHPFLSMHHLPVLVLAAVLLAVLMPRALSRVRAWVRTWARKRRD